MMPGMMPGMTAQFLFVHGWALDSSLWDGMCAAMEGRAAVVRELGYFGPVPRQPSVDPAAASGPVIAVGHSLGLMQLLEAPPAGLAGLVAINGFSRFAAAADHPAGVPARLLHRMQQRLEQDADATVTAFRRRCGMTRMPPGPAMRPALHGGLELLCDGDGRETLRRLPCPVLALAGGQDPIVPPGLTRACFDRITWVEAAGHLLPLTHPEHCARMLCDFADAIA